MQRDRVEFTSKEKAGIYLKAMIYGFKTSAEFGLVAAGFGYFTGYCVGASRYNCPNSEALESCISSGFISENAFQTGVKGALYSGIVTTLFTFVPAVNEAIDKGFAEAAYEKFRSNHVTF